MLFSYEKQTELITNNDIIINNLISKINKTYMDYGEDITIKEGNIIYSLSNYNNQKNNENKNVSTINLGDCEAKLKKVYNISNNNSLYIIKIDIMELGMKIPKIEYEVYYSLYNETLFRLNLEECKDIKIDISIPVSIKDNIDKYNSSSDYYNNICYKTTSDSGTDIILSDRKNIFIEKNMTLCEEDCDLIEYNYTSERAKCSCKVKINLPLIEDIKFDKNKIYKSFTDIKNFSNLYIMKCYKYVFQENNIIKNIGFIIFICLFVFYFITLFLFYCKYYFALIIIIKNIYNAKKNNFNHKNELNKNNSIIKITNNNQNKDIKNKDKKRVKK